MSQSPTSRDENESESGKLSLIFSLFICLGLASFCFWQQHELAAAGHNVWSELCLHIGVSFVVAATIIAVIELKAQRLAERETRRFRNQVSRDVFKALLGQIVPTEVVQEINNILHSEIVRRDCQYRIIFRRPNQGMSKDYFIIRREVTYKVENLLSHKTTFVARSSHSEDADLIAAHWSNRNFHLKLLVDNVELPLIQGKNIFIDGDSMRLAQEVTLGPRQIRSIAFHGEEPSRISAGRNSYLQATPVIGIAVDVVNEYQAVFRIDDDLLRKKQVLVQNFTQIYKGN